MLTVLKNRHQLERYFLAGCLIFCLGHIQYRLLYALLDVGTMRAGAAWVLHFVIGMVWSHAIHRAYTFRGKEQLPYFKSLFLTCGLYLFMLTVSTFLMVLLCDMGGTHPVSGWAVVTIFTALGNYLLMSRWSICRTSKEGSDGFERPYPDCSHQERSF